MSSANYIIQSKIDSQQFKVYQNVIDASVLLKNCCELTKITEPITIECSSQSLDIFVKLIDHYQNIGVDEHDMKFENDLYKNFSDEQLKELIQDLCKIDSDFFLDSVADFMLSKMEKMTTTEIQEYLGLEDDFSLEEREIIDKNKTEYFLSIVIDGLDFPFQNKSLCSMKTKFSTPFNALIIRVIQRSNELVSRRLSAANKALKNEIDKQPLKVTKFRSSGNTWIFQIDKPKFQPFFVSLNPEKFDEKYFNAIRQRKIIVEKFETTYDKYDKNQSFTPSSSFNFIVSKNQFAEAKITFQSDSDLMYKFDVTKCQIPNIFFEFCGSPDSVKTFKEIYDHLIAKDLSKKITLWIWGHVRFHNPNNLLRFHKMPNASKFHFLAIKYVRNFLPEFQTFIMNYMDNNGLLNSEYKIKEIPGQESEKMKGKHNYRGFVIKKYLEEIITNK